MAEHKRILDARSSPAEYDDDFALWARQQAELMAAHRWEEIDLTNLIDEVESLAKRDFRKLVSAIRVILTHMLKWDYQPELRSESWRRSIRDHRDLARDVLGDSPSFQSRLVDAIAAAYESARRRAAFETTVFEGNFPEACPYDWEAIMNRKHEFFPDQTV